MLTSGRSPWLTGLISAASTLFAVVLLTAVVGLVLYWAPGPRARAGASTVVVLRPGARVAEIAADLERAGVVRSAPLFMASAQLTGAARRLKAGEYSFPSGASLQRVVAELRSGNIVHHRITIPEGLTSRQAMDVLLRSDVLAGTAPTPPEGAILPETYEVVRGETRAAVLKRMTDADDRLLSVLWDKRRAGLPFTNVEQAVVLASIVEKETALESERPRVAAVYLNRLKQGMKLEADPTVIYGVNGGEPLGRGLRESELQAQTPYNTYLNPGLPPTPIDNPGRASLAAVLDPPDTADLYFVADGTGGHAFSSTLAEHDKNVARWRRIEARRAGAAPSLALPAAGSALTGAISGTVPGSAEAAARPPSLPAIPKPLEHR